MKLSRLAWMLLPALVLASCSLHRSEDEGKPFTIQLVKDGSAPKTDLAAFLGISTSPSPAPSTIDDMSCFAVNVTGPGVIPRNQDLHNCDMSDDYAPIGFGRTSDALTFGTPITLDIPSGSSRTIDVIGLIKDGGGFHCDNSPSGGGDSLGLVYGYLVGRVQKSILNSETVTINVGYSGEAPKLACSDDNPSMVPSGSTGNGSAIYKPVSGCISAPAGAPSLANFSEFASTDYSRLTSGGDSQYLQTGCSWASAGNGVVMYILIDASSAGDLTRYVKATIEMSGGIGQSSGCSSVDPASPPASMNGELSLEIYRPGTGWQTLATKASGVSGVLNFNQSYNISNPADYVLLSGGQSQIWYRVVTGATVGCAEMYIDWMRFRLFRT